MKMREGDSQFKRPFGSLHGESGGQTQIHGAGAAGGGAGGNFQKLTPDDALTYLKQVRVMFQGQSEKYDMFLEVMRDFKAQRTDITGVIARVKELFKGDNNLILGFNTFLPKGYEITLEDNKPPLKKNVELDAALLFVKKIKERFHNDEHIYKSFLNILNVYQKEHEGVNEVYSEVAGLFEDHIDLLDEFKRFLPDSVTKREVHSQSSIQRHNDWRFATPPLLQMHIEKRRENKIITPHADRDLSVDSLQLGDDKVTLKRYKVQKKHAKKESRDWRNRDEDYIKAEHEKNKDLRRVAERKTSAQKAEGFVPNSNYPSLDEIDTSKGMYRQTLMFCEKAKERLCNSDDYHEFLKCLGLYSKGIIKRNDLLKLVTDLLGKYPDIMEELNYFLERCQNENMDGFLAGVMSKNGHLSRSLKALKKDEEQKHDQESSKEKDKCGEKYMEKSIQELDLSNCEQCTPSYRLLPDDYQIRIPSQRSELDAQVLNDHWVSVTSGSEDYSFKHMRRNQYEESLFKCEDDRFELDMLIESVNSTAKCVEELLMKINDCAYMQSENQIDCYFTASNIRCIERLYGDHGLDVLDMLRTNLVIALPVILTRLKQRQDEWTRSRSDLNKVWADMYVKNHYKSLDHRSFYFKQQDSKTLGRKSLVAEIKELKQKHEQEDDTLLAFASGSKHVIPHLEYEYSDFSIHEDLCKLVQYSCKELCSTKEQLRKVMNFWSTFLEPMLGIFSHPNHTVSTAHAGKCTASSIGEGDKDESAMLRPAKCTSKRLEDVDIVAKGDSMMGTGGVGKNDLTSDAPLLGREGKNIDHIDRFSGSSIQISSDQISSDQVAVDGRTSAEVTEGHAMISSPHGESANDDNKPKARTNVASPPECEDLSFMSKKGIKVNRPNDYFSGIFEPEKEEGELSSNGDFEEDNFVVDEDAGVLLMPRVKDEKSSLCKSVNDEDSENFSKVGDEISVSESADDECSGEEHEDVLEHEAESEGEAKEMADTQLVGGGDSISTPSDHFLSSLKPLAKLVPPGLLIEEQMGSRVFFGNDDFYVLFRLHQVLYQRILSVKENSSSAEMRHSNDTDYLDPYSRFMSVLYNLLDGSIDNVQYEDECQAVIGNQSYVLFTLDKLIYKFIKQLQIVATDYLDNKLIELYMYEKLRGSGKMMDSVYYENSRFVLEEENIFRFEYLPAPSRLSIQLMDNVMDTPEFLAVSINPDFAAYLENDFLPVFKGKKEPLGITMRRNKRKYAGTDEYSAICMAMEGVKMFNGLECKMICNSYKISYVLDTEDFFYRLKRRRRKLTSVGSYNGDQTWSRVDRFRRFLSNS